MTSVFKEVDSSFVLLRTAGVIREAKVFSCTLDKDDTLYARVGTGFIKLYKHQNMTSKTGTYWVHVGLHDGVTKYTFDSLGVMVAVNA
jgi:hypothetical protein